MGIEKHLVILADVRNQPECITGALLHLGGMDASKQTNDQLQSNSLLDRFLSQRQRTIASA